MKTPSTQDISRMLHDWSNGDEAMPARLMPLVYDELRRLADHYLRGERPDHTLQPTALVHEAYLRLTDQTGMTWQNRAHFFAVAAQSMRQVLVDHARSHRAAKRGSGQKLALDEAAGISQPQEVDLLALDEALSRLAVLDPQQSRIVELRYFGGLTVEETAEVMGLSPRTVKRAWQMAKAWLRLQIRN